MERIVESPVGPLKIEGDDRSITGIWLNATSPATPGRASGVLAELERQLDAYFAGALTVFDLPLAPRGTAFQIDVWSALRQIPYGATCSYSDIAHKIGRADAVRAVGAANGQNPIPIVIPPNTRSQRTRSSSNIGKRRARGANEDRRCGPGSAVGRRGARGQNG